MWGVVTDRPKALKQAIEFTSDHELYGEHMRRVTEEWPISCENALTDYHLNRKAWLGHAAVALALEIPEDITRQSWAHLTDEQQLLANQEASRAIQAWEYTYIKDRQLYRNLEAPLLFAWDS